MNGIWLPAAALIISIFLFILFFAKKNSSTEETKIYAWMVMMNLIYSLLGIGLYVYAMIKGDIEIINIVQKIYLSTLLFFVFLEVMYDIVINKFSQKTTNIIKNINLAILFIGLFLILSLKLNTIIEGEILDLDGISYASCMITGIIYIIEIVILKIIYSFKTKKIIKSVPFIIMIILVGVAGYLRHFAPEVITETFIISLFTLTLYHTIENPDMKMIEELRKAKDAATKANRAKSDFLSSMSHEIRTPLNAIVGLSEALSNNKTVDGQAKEDAKDILMASNTLLEIVGNILDINKLESNEMKIIETPYNLRELTLQIAKLNANKLVDKPIDFKVSIAEDLPYELIGDKNHMRDIINNLLTNAVKYTEKGFINLVIKCINVNDESTLIISIQDSGKGIKKEDINKLFNKFERLDIEKNSTTEGTGLGLAITKQLIELMGGKINVQSSFGEGSMFVCRIPQKISQLVAPIKEKEETKKENNNNIGNKKVLIVDDNKLNIKVARRALEGFDFDIDEAINGQDAINKVEFNKYDLILMDIMMPVMSGETALQKLKEKEDFEIPTIALTADAVSGAKEKYLSQGFTDYIAKPFTKDEIKEKINTIFEKEKEPVNETLEEATNKILEENENRWNGVEGVVITGEKEDE